MSFWEGDEDLYLLAWTTTPWTLPSNTALAVNKKVDYVLVKTINQYTKKPVVVILSEKLLGSVFSSPYVPLSSELDASKEYSFEVVKTIKGQDLVGLSYEQLMPLVKPFEKPEAAFKICLLYTSPSPRDATLSRMPSSA